MGSYEVFEFIYLWNKSHKGTIQKQNHWLTYLSEAHVLFDGVDASLEVGSGSVHVGDHRTNVTDDGGKDQHANLEHKTLQ